MTNREIWMKENRKNIDNYTDKIVISDSSPLIALNSINKLDFLKLLFKGVYATPTVKEECKKGENGFDLPDWIIIKQPNLKIESLIKGRGWDAGEKSAFALAIQMDAFNEENNINEKNCLILDDHEARKAHKRKSFGVDTVSLRDIFSFAFDKGLFTRVEGERLIEEMGVKTRSFKKNDIMVIFNDTITKNKDKNHEY